MRPLQAVGFSLDDTRNEIAENDLPDCATKYKEFVLGRKYDIEPSEGEKWFWVDKETLKANKYDLSISKYKKVNYTPVEYEKPEILLSQIKELEMKILEGLEEVGDIL